MSAWSEELGDQARDLEDSGRPLAGDEQESGFVLGVVGLGLRVVVHQQVVCRAAELRRTCAQFLFDGAEPAIVDLPGSRRPEPEVRKRTRSEPCGLVFDPAQVIAFLRRPGRDGLGLGLLRGPQRVAAT